MMQEQDKAGCGLGSGYNELVIDSWRQPFKSEWVQAVVVQPGMSADKIVRAKAAQAAYVSEFGGDMPLLLYDANATMSPFSFYTS